MKHLLIGVCFLLFFCSCNKTAEEYYDAGIKKYNAEDYKGAIECFDKVIELTPEYALVYNDRGVANVALGNYQEAVQDYTKALELSPKLSIAYFNRGMSRLMLEDLNSACNDWLKSEELGEEEATKFIKEYCKH